MMVIFLIGLCSSFIAFSREGECSVRDSVESREKVVKRHVDLAEEGVKRMSEFVRLCRESVNSYIPVSNGKWWRGGREWTSMQDAKEVKEVLNGYRGLYLYYSEETGLSCCVVLKQGRVYFVQAVYGNPLYGRKFNTLEEYDKYCLGVFEELFALPENQKEKMMGIAQKVEELSPFFESREDIFGANRTAFYPFGNNFEIRGQEISSELSKRIYDLLAAFRQFGERKATFLPEALFGDKEREMALFSACDPKLSRKGYRQYGMDGQVFGLSLPGADMLATEYSWPVYLEQLFDALKAYCSLRGTKAEEKKEEVIRLCTEIEKRIREKGMDTNPFFRDEPAGLDSGE